MVGPVIFNAYFLGASQCQVEDFKKEGAHLRNILKLSKVFQY